MDNYYLDSANLYRMPTLNHGDSHVNVTQLQPAMPMEDEREPVELFNYDLEMSSYDLESNQLLLNMMFLQNQLIQVQQLQLLLLQLQQQIQQQVQQELQHPQPQAQFQYYHTSDQQVITPTGDFFSSDDGNWSDSYLFCGETSYVPDLKMPVPNPIQSSSLQYDGARTLSGVAHSKIGRSQSHGAEIETSLSSSVKPVRPEIKQSKSFAGSSPNLSSPKVNSTFIREYQNKKISKFIKGTKKTNQGYKNFINYKFTGDNFERDS